MNNIFWMVNLENVTFDMCGLDLDKNILTAPSCECGCGGKGKLIFESVEDVEDFCITMVKEDECQCCAVFSIFNNGIMKGVVKIYNNIYEFTFCNKYDFKAIGEVAKESMLHCYGLIVETEDGLWKIIEE